MQPDLGIRKCTLESLDQRVLFERPEIVDIYRKAGAFAAKSTFVMPLPDLPQNVNVPLFRFGFVIPPDVDSVL